MSFFIIAALLVIGIMFFINRDRPEEERPDWLNTLETVLRLLWNKGVALLALVFLMHHFATLEPDKPAPFAELLYKAIQVGCVLVGGPLFRILMFPEAAEFAEGGNLRKAIATGQFPYAVSHYRFATALSFASVALCVSSLL